MAPPQIANALAAPQLAIDAGVPCPRLLAYAPDTALGRSVVLHEWLAGDDAETMWSHMSLDEQLRFALGQAIAALHSSPVPCYSEDAALTRPMAGWHAGLYDYLTEDADGMRQLRLLPPATLETLADHLRQAIAALSPAIRPALTHWDLWLVNTVVDTGRFVGRSAGIASPSQTPSPILFGSKSGCLPPSHSRTLFFDGYFALRPIDRNHAVRLDVYLGLEYFAEIYRTTAWSDLRPAGHFRE